MRVFRVGATAAIGAGLSAVSGLTGLSRQSKQAAAEREALEKQKQQNTLQAQLQLYSLRNQRMVDDLNDKLTENAAVSSYLQTQSSLKAQEATNELALQNAKFQAQVQQQMAGVGETQADMQARQQESDSRLRAGAEALEAYGSATTEEQQVLNSLLESLGKGDNQQNAIASLLDLAAASGGVNEALELLGNSASFEDVVANARALRADSSAQQKMSNADDVAVANAGLGKAAAGLTRTNASLDATNARYQGRAAELDANTSAEVSRLGFDSERTANEANYNIGFLSRDLQRTSRYYQSQANEEAIKKGAQLQNDITSIQQGNIRSPGLFDYLGTGFNSYNVWKQLGGQITPTSKVMRTGVDVTNSYGSIG